MQKSIVQITQEEFEKLVSEEVNDITEAAIKQFQDTLERNELVLTAQLKESFTKFIVSNSVAMIAQAQIEFNAYGRFKDMRSYAYATGKIPPVHEIEWFVMKEGLENFGWIMNYRYTKDRPSAFISEQRTINRIAWIIAMNKRRFPNVKRGYRGSWYNNNKMQYINEVKKRLRWRIASAVHAAQRGVFDDMAK